MDTAPIIGSRYDHVVREGLATAEAGDYRARRVAVGPRGGIVTPHRDKHGQLDRDDLAAQVYAICHDLSSNNGEYTGGRFIADSNAYCISAPDPDDQEK